MKIMKETQVEIKRAPKPKLFQKRLQDFWVKTVNTHLTDAEKDINKKFTSPDSTYRVHQKLTRETNSTPLPFCKDYCKKVTSPYSSKQTVMITNT